MSRCARDASVQRLTNNSNGSLSSLPITVAHLQQDSGDKCHMYHMERQKAVTAAGIYQAFCGNTNNNNFLREK